ncbi:hypothetical protein BRADI_1g65431v3 [Brachypodium distachyon]|uniref:Uncharacterized protein n=1 Tax=Brachypodium distachyon TaxID=15368 RepID=A0A2K2DTI5_BRADI|nr:hypothetical protein BRADI_1g65431v3 [Brachypodium distachyon]
MTQPLKHPYVFLHLTNFSPKHNHISEGNLILATVKVSSTPAIGIAVLYYYLRWQPHGNSPISIRLFLVFKYGRCLIRRLYWTNGGLLSRVQKIDRISSRKPTPALNGRPAYFNISLLRTPYRFTQLFSVVSTPPSPLLCRRSSLSFCLCATTAIQISR